MSGTIKRTELLTHTINHAWKNQRHLVALLIDLKNAFGEVDHSLVKFIYSYHHIPSKISDLLQRLYQNYFVSTRTKTFTTNPIKVGKGVPAMRLSIATFVVHVH